MVKTKKRKIQIAALELGYQDSTKINTANTLKLILKENRKKQNFESADNFLLDAKKIIGDDIYKYWLKIAEKTLK
jgi:hypothetical protein